MKKITLFLFFLLIWSNWSYADCISGDCVNGKGTFTSSNGTKFEGEFKNGKRDGKGTYTFPDGRKVVGIWKDDELQR